MISSFWLGTKLKLACYSCRPDQYVAFVRDPREPQSLYAAFSLIRPACMCCMRPVDTAPRKKAKGFSWLVIILYTSKYIFRDGTGRYCFDMFGGKKNDETARDGQIMKIIVTWTGRWDGVDFLDGDGTLQ